MPTFDDLLRISIQKSKQEYIPLKELTTEVGRLGNFCPFRIRKPGNGVISKKIKSKKTRCG